MIRETMAVMDVDSQWDFSDASASGERFRGLVKTLDEPDRSIAKTQLARALGLQERWDEAHAELDSVSDAYPEVQVREALERGRLWRSAGDPLKALPHFEQAVTLARQSATAQPQVFENLLVDAMHMVALVLDGEQQLAATREAIEEARNATSQRAKDWLPSLLNNEGMALSELGDWEGAHACFVKALELRKMRNDAEATHVAVWMVAWSLRHLGHRDQALALQRELKAALDARGASDTYVVEEIEILLRG